MPSVGVRNGRSPDATARLAEARQRILELEAQIVHSESRDPLARTLLTLTSFRTQLDLDVARAQRYQRPLAVAVLDVDGFRRINLRHGFAGGDQVLIAVGSVISDETRVHDLAYRMSGDEFALLLPETAAEAAAEAAARIADALPLGISFGIALFPDDGGTSNELIGRADQALYDAKRSKGTVRFAA